MDERFLDKRSTKGDFENPWISKQSQLDEIELS